METKETCNPLEILDAQYDAIWKRINGIKRDIEMAYYNGSKDMLKLMSGKSIGVDKDGKHYYIPKKDEDQ